MWRWLAIVGLMVLFLPVNGQDKTSDPKGDKEHAEQNIEKCVPTPITVNCGESNLVQKQAAAKETDGTKDQPEGYFHTLISPNNLPNLLLFLAGIVGIGIAIATLRTIKRQVDTFVSKERARITVATEPLNPNGEAGSQIVYDKSPMLLPRNAIWNVDIHIANSGETNAFIGAAFCKACIKESNWNARDEIVTSQIGLPKVMRPTEKPLQHRERVEMDRKTATAIAEGSLRLWVIGRIEFGDVFGNHWTLKFCRQWGGTWFGGQWQFASVWKDYEPQTPGSFKMNGEFRIKRPSLPRQLVRRMRKKDPQAPVIEIT
jgi:hypothetical protein